MKRNEKVVFKEYVQGQPMLLPPNLEELIPEKHVVRVISEVVDRMDLSPVIKKYKGGGTSSYHPKMLIKILIYAYGTKIYSGRKIAKAMRENIHYMWLSGGNQPDFRTINRFRGDKLKREMQEIFTEVLEYLVETGYIRLENYFADGTKIEANANKYSPRLTRFRKQAFEKLTSKKGRELSSKRMAEPEAVFGLFKGNKQFRRFHLRGLDKVAVEWGLLAIAHNLSKIAAFYAAIFSSLFFLTQKFYF